MSQLPVSLWPVLPIEMHSREGSHQEEAVGSCSRLVHQEKLDMDIADKDMGMFEVLLYMLHAYGNQYLCMHGARSTHQDVEAAIASPALGSYML